MITTPRAASPGYHDADPLYGDRALMILNTDADGIVAIVIGRLLPSEIASGDVDIRERSAKSAHEIILRRRADVERLIARAQTPHVRKCEILQTAAVGMENWPTISICKESHFLAAMFPKAQFSLQEDSLFA